MKASFVVKTPLSIALWDGGGEIEFDAIISFKVHPGCQAASMTPAEEPTVEVTRFQIARMGGVIAECPDWLSYRFESDDSFNGWLMQEANEQAMAAAEDAADAKRDERELEAS